MIDIDALQPWLGRERCAADEVSATQARRMAALLDLEPRQWAGGDALPAHWYCMLFGETARQSQLGTDGHPEKGDFLPPVMLPRRMFAGRRVQFQRSLHIGEQVVRRTRIQAITPKRGRSGEMCFVTLRHDIDGEQGTAVVEEQDIVYRQASPPRQASADKPPELPARREMPTLGATSITPDTTMLFRYSAITFNGHRIHYDRDYASGVEGYPGLVVNGGLTLLLLWEQARQSGLAFSTSVSRNLKGLIAGQPLYIRTEQRETGTTIYALDAAGEVAVEAVLAGESA
ncbi:FAS1-like dehydratase domain-containing protein [Bordetella genomosp. 12]|uniref:FAS1-like dehydratase domain-containing protein n=1 Tax=Bordetella genomosp. 12 TaxID=463035 RepID=A0A261VEH7_9BORD|nr:MaoC family dehydratase N-terminal domain-containing protein [Bordetella genomosp. 12]OZI71563.1 hypothetical protein CAL22_17280 [Bordetella genomosp. 12]